MKAALEFLGFKVKSIDYNLINLENFRVDGDSETLKKLENNHVDIDISAKIYDYTDEENSDVEVNINTTDKLIDEVRRVNFTIIGTFKVDAPEASDEERENLLQINATAILLPYCRSYLSSLTGFDTSQTQLLMPPFNVERMFDNKN